MTDAQQAALVWLIPAAFRITRGTRSPEGHLG
jgi:hypothetical protein